MSGLALSFSFIYFENFIENFTFYQSICNHEDHHLNLWGWFFVLILIKKILVGKIQHMTERNALTTEKS